MMAALAGVAKEDDKEVARKMFRSGDVNKQVDDVSKSSQAPKSDFISSVLDTERHCEI